MSKKKKILFTGGGSGGPVSPLLAIYDFIINSQDKENYEFYWIGTENGPEKKMVKEAGIKFKSVKAGKFRRYFDWRNFIDPFKILIGFFQSIFFILHYQPSLIVSAGGFVSVPVAWAGKLLGVKILIHQQDIRPGLANKLMFPIANLVTVTFEKSLADYPRKSVWTSNPVREEIRKIEKKDKKEGYKVFGFNNNKPVVLFIGGGTGAYWLNQIVQKELNNFLKLAQVIHITGSGKGENLKKNGYRQFEFLDGHKMAQALNLADLVVSRAGLGMISEIAYLKKASILIPMPATHQEDNAYICDQIGGSVVLNQHKTSGSELVIYLAKLLKNDKKRRKLEEKMGELIKRDAQLDMKKQIDLLLK